MTVVTISRQYGSGGDEIALQVAELLDYRVFSKETIAQVASEVGLAEDEVVDFSETTYRKQSFLDRLMGVFGGESVSVAPVLGAPGYAAGMPGTDQAGMDEARLISVVRSSIEAAHERGNVVIVGRGGQAVLESMAGVLHVRIEAPLDVRARRVQEQTGVTLEEARKAVRERDKASATYLKRFYDVDWSDNMLYHLVINSSKLEAGAAADLIARAVEHLATPAAPEGDD
jgi:cytidylate kinase